MHNLWSQFDMSLQPFPSVLEIQENCLTNMGSWQSYTNFHFTGISPFFQDQKNQNDTFSAIEKELMMSLLNGIQSDRAKRQKKQAKKQKVSKKKMDVHFALFFRLFRRVVTHDDFLLKYF